MAPPRNVASSGQVAPLSTSKGPGTGEPHKFFYPEGPADVGVIAYGTAAAATGQLARLVAGESAKAIATKGSFTIALTGGARPLGSQLAAVLFALTRTARRVYTNFQASCNQRVQ